MHHSALDYAEEYYETESRRVYITPTSFLELIKTFSGLLDKRRTALLAQRKRYIRGLEKLAETEESVVALQ
ncbi:dynein heavy chain, partial [Kipferlia bialata]|eukprot:g16565.t1